MTGETVFWIGLAALPYAYAGYPVLSNSSSAMLGREERRFDDRMMANGGAPSGFGCRGWGDGQRF
jgi:hypothetical protein